MTPDDDERREAALAKRLDQLDRRLLRLERDVGISVEMMALFVRAWLSAAPSLPEQERTEARAKGGERYDAFVAALGRRLARGPVLRRKFRRTPLAALDLQCVQDWRIGRWELTHLSPWQSPLAGALGPIEPKREALTRSCGVSIRFQEA
jgi:hypothetical protein